MKRAWNPGVGLSGECGDAVGGFAACAAAGVTSRFVGTSVGNMSLAALAVRQLEAARDQFLVSTNQFDEGMTGFRPAEGAMNVAQHIAHTAQVIDWLREGALSPEGFDLEFEAQIAKVMASESLAVAREWFDRAMAMSIETLGRLDDDQLLQALPAGPILGGLPRLAVAGAMAEHTSHHRGALAVYARVLGLVPASPYGL
jgi:uncharacterized damage-inducible protein DinB